MAGLPETTANPDKAPALSVLPFTRADIEQTVPARFEAVVRRFPHYLALTGQGKQWTYRDLDGRVNCIAHAIVERARPGSGNVAFLVDHSPEMVIATLAVLKAGKTYLAIFPAMPRDRQAEIVRDVVPELIVTTTALESRAAELAAGVCSILILDQIDDLPVEKGPNLAVRPQHPSTLFYTSGTTGLPKGVVKSHRAVLHRIWLAVRHDAVVPTDRQSLLTHCSFSASETDMFGALLNGATLCVFDFATEGLPAFREWLDAEQITLLHPPVLLFRRFLATLSGKSLFPHVRLVALAGDTVLPADVEAWKRHFASSCLLMHRFSTTETGLLCIARIEWAEVDRGFELAGWPVDDKSLLLLDQAGEVVSAGETGELVVKSPYIADGYWRRTDETTHAFPEDSSLPGSRIYRTGDLGKFLSDGRFIFLGRSDRQVKIRGFRVELGEVEASLSRHSGVREAAVIVQDRVPNDKQLVAYLVASREPPPSWSELREFLQRRLPPYMIPSRFLFLEALPVTPTGKIDRQGLPLLEASSLPASPSLEPRTEIERELVGIWRTVLGLAHVGIRDNFFDLGGHSLLAAQMFQQLEERLRVRLPLATLFRAPTIEQLAAAIGEGHASLAWRSLVTIQPAGRGRPIFAVPGVGGNVLCLNEFASLMGTDQPFYGLQSKGLGGTERPLTSIEDIAAAHLSEIRAVQPEGPYHLVGVCMGAVVVYEIAQRLHGAGQSVGLLALIEPRPPVGTPRREFRPVSRTVSALRLIVSRLQLYVRTFVKLRGRRRMEYLRERLSVLKQIFHQRDLFRGNREGLHAEVVRQANLAAVHRYLPRPYPGPVLLCLAAGRKIDSEEDPRLKWNRLAAGGLEVHDVPGDDSGLTLVRPNVEVLAPLVKSRLVRESVAGAPREPASSRQVDSVADGFVEELNTHAVEYVFINPGSDIAPIQESIAKFKARRRRAPQLILCQHESVAMAAAHGYFMITGRPQVVLVHADVGTQNIGANLHNAQRGRAGVVICAGTAPRTVAGRNRHMDWIQAQVNLAASVDGYVKWHHEVTGPDDLHSSMQRAFQVAGAEPTGPVYLTLPKDVLLEPMSARPAAPARDPDTATAAADPKSIVQAAQWLVESERPLILVAYAGRNPEAVAPLVRLAETLAAPVVESRNRVNFPTSHPLHLGFCASPWVERSDCVLILDHDVPWVPAEGEPSADCRIIHIDIDTQKKNMPAWGFPVDLSIEADSRAALSALAREVERRLTGADRTRIEVRRRAMSAEHAVQQAGRRQRGRDLAARRPISPEWAAHCLNQLIDVDTRVIGEAVSNNPALWHHLELDAPGTYYQSLGSGLGWGLGAALGAKLAAPSHTIICVLGDGSWVFGSPIAAYGAAERYHAPFLTVMFNNQGYAATREAIRSVAPHGYARETDEYPGCDLPTPRQQYARLAEAMGLWAATVEDPAKLPAVLLDARNEVRRGRSALVDIRIASSWGYQQLPDE